MNTTGRKCSVSTAARAFSRYTGPWAVLCASLGMLGCVAIEEPIDSSALAGEIRESVMRDSLGTELAPISAAIARSNAQADLDLNLLVRIEVQPNEMLEIYEPAPGRIVISTAGAPTGESLLPPHVTEGLSVEEIWDLAAGSAEMPGELRAAMARARERMEAGGPAMQEGIELPEAPRAGALATATPVAADLEPPSTSAGWCDTEYFFQGYGRCFFDFDYYYCPNDWWGNISVSYYSAWYVYTNVCPATGPVTLRVTASYGNNPGGYWYVPQNTVRQWSDSDPECGSLSNWCMDVRSAVEQASGDRLHFRFFALY
jgi:hypothetical protein